MSTFLALVIIFMIGWLIARSTSKPGDTKGYESHEMTAQELLAELKAQEELDTDWTFLKPDYGMYHGERIATKNITPLIKSDPSFRSPQSLGKWVRK